MGLHSSIDMGIEDADLVDYVGGRLGGGRSAQKKEEGKKTKIIVLLGL